MNPRNPPIRRLVRSTSLAAILVAGLPGAVAPAVAEPPAIQSMSALAFAPDGTLFVGDGKAGAVWALDLGERAPAEAPERFAVADVEARIAALLGRTADEVMVHDLAVDPVSKGVYLAVSLGRQAWDSAWDLPNELADATILLQVGPEGQLSEVPLEASRARRAALPNPIDPAKTHRWKEGVSLRSEAITDLEYADGTLYVAGLSNEEFASTMWKVPYPFGDGATATTLEIFHGAHGAYETHAPIRTFVPYDLAGERHVLAAYLCTPFVTFRDEELSDGEHVKGRTLAEFGSGNYPLDMVVYEKEGKEKLLIANSNLPLMIVDPEAIAGWKDEITSRPDGYVAGLPYEVRSGAGVQQLARLDAERLVALARKPSGSLDLEAIPVRWF